MKARIHSALALTLALAAFSAVAAQDGGQKAQGNRNAEIKKENGGWSFVPTRVAAQNALRPGTTAALSSISSRRNALPAGRYNPAADKLYRCPFNLPAEVTTAPPGWELKEISRKFTLSFDSVDAAKISGKQFIICTYKASGFVVITQEIPFVYSCSRVLVDPREMLCKTIIKIPGK